MKVVILAGGLGTRLVGRDCVPPEADGRDRRAADPVAHHEELQPPRVQRLRGLPRLQGLHDQGVLLELLPAHVRRDLRHERQLDGHPPERRRAVARHPGRHRRGHPDGRPDQAGRRLHPRRHVHAHLRRRRRRPRHRASCSHSIGDTASSRRSPPSSRSGGSDRSRSKATRQSGVSSRPASAPSRRSRSATARGSTAGSSCSSRRCWTRSTATRPLLEACAARRPRRRRRADGLPPPRLLAADGRAARPAHCCRVLWESGTSALEGLF